MGILPFSKYHGNGNDFILVDDRKKKFPIDDKLLVKKLCHRNLGIGADGIILLQPSDIADSKMRILNSDGSEAQSCGNGLCCFNRFMKDLGYEKDVFLIEINGAIIESIFRDNKVILDMPNPEILNKNVKIKLDDQQIDVCYIDSGVPHIVYFVDNIDKINVKSLGSKLRYHSSFQPSGANVDFAQLIDEHTVRVRTYERGVEDETCSCGTGSVATAVATYLKFGFIGPISICFKYGNIDVSFNVANGVVDKVKLKNSVSYVYSGEVIV